MGYYLLTTFLSEAEFSKPQERNFVVIAESLPEAKSAGFKKITLDGKKILFDTIYILSWEEAEPLLASLPVIKANEYTRSFYGLL